MGEGLWEAQVLIIKGVRPAISIRENEEASKRRVRRGNESDGVRFISPTRTTKEEKRFMPPSEEKDKGVRWQWEENSTKHFHSRGAGKKP